jgi:extradiol dioxygenase family protein
VDFDFFGHQISMHLGEPFKTQNTARWAVTWYPCRTLVWC